MLHAIDQSGSGISFGKVYGDYLAATLGYDIVSNNLFGFVIGTFNQNIGLNLFN